MKCQNLTIIVKFWKLNKQLNNGNKKKLTPIGRIVVLKTLILPKINHLIHVL